LACPTGRRELSVHGPWTRQPLGYPYPPTKDRLMSSPHLQHPADQASIHPQPLQDSPFELSIRSTAPSLVCVRKELPSLVCLFIRPSASIVTLCPFNDRSTAKSASLATWRAFVANSIMDDIPVTGLDELEQHLDCLVRDPSIPVNAKLLDDIELQLTGTLPCPLMDAKGPGLTRDWKRQQHPPPGDPISAQTHSHFEAVHRGSGRYR